MLGKIARAHLLKWDFDKKLLIKPLQGFEVLTIFDPAFHAGLFMFDAIASVIIMHSKKSEPFFVFVPLNFWRAISWQTQKKVRHVMKFISQQVYLPVACWIEIYSTVFFQSATRINTNSPTWNVGNRMRKIENPEVGSIKPLYKYNL